MFQSVIIILNTVIMMAEFFLYPFLRTNFSLNISIT